MNRRMVLAFTCVGALIGCGGSAAVEATAGGPLVEEPPVAGPVSVRGSTEARASVDAAGGTLALANGARLTIPQDALTTPTEVVFRVGADGHAFGDRERQRALGPMLVVEPAIVSEGGAPFELSIPAQPLPPAFEPPDLAFAIEEIDEGARAIDTLATQTRWQFYPVAVENERFVVRTSGFAGQRVQFGVAR